MKYLEKWSWFKSKYVKREELKEDDYIYFDDFSARGKIFKKRYLPTTGNLIFDIDTEDGKTRVTGLVEPEIRYMTPEEIEDYEMKKTASQYNL